VLQFVNDENLSGRWGRIDMERVFTISKSFEEADRTDKAYYRSLTPQQRLQILLELNSRWPTDDHAQASERLERVYRVIKRT
jgi:hypothetical protein